MTRLRLRMLSLGLIAIVLFVGWELIRLFRFAMRQKLLAVKADTTQVALLVLAMAAGLGSGLLGLSVHAQWNALFSPEDIAFIVLNVMSALFLLFFAGIIFYLTRRKDY